MGNLVLSRKLNSRLFLNDEIAITVTNIGRISTVAITGPEGTKLRRKDCAANFTIKSGAVADFDIRETLFAPDDHSQVIVINDEIEVRVTEAKSLSQLRLSISAPPHIAIHREEIKKKLTREESVRKNSMAIAGAGQ